jgi:hypothetical protein
MTSSGPLWCYKADISKDTNYWDDRDKTVTAACCGMEEYVLADGLTFKFNVGNSSDSGEPTKSVSSLGYS